MNNWGSPFVINCHILIKKIPHLGVVSMETKRNKLAAYEYLGQFCLRMCRQPWRCTRLQARAVSFDSNADALNWRRGTPWLTDHLGLKSKF